MKGFPAPAAAVLALALPAAARNAAAQESPAQAAQARSAATGGALAGPDISISTAPPLLNVVWPREGERLENLSRTFAIGRVAAGSTLTVNGLPAPTEPDGAFLAMVALSTGASFIEFRAELAGAATAMRRMVQVAPPAGWPPAREDELVALEPAEDLELAPGDILVVRCKGPPGREVSLRVRGLAAELPMAEAAGSGIYEGHYVVAPPDSGKGLEAECAMRPGFWRTARAAAPGRVSIIPAGLRRVALTTGRATVLKSAAQGYSLFLPPGVKLELTGRRGGMARASLADGLDAWVEASRLELLPEGTPPPRGRVGKNLYVATGEDSSRLIVELDERLPFEVRQTVEPLAFEVRFFNASQRLDRIHHPAGDPVFKEARWRQESGRVVLLQVETRLAWGWGYDASYDDKGRFALEVRRPPDLSLSTGPLAGRRIVLDPGHGPDPGAMGPRGTFERDVNLDLALALRGLLEAEGAEVVLTRLGPDGPALADRGPLAWERKGDVLLSLHNNSLPPSADPFSQPRGYSMYYYHPQSLRLAETVLAAYRGRHPDLGDEGLVWADLAVCRATQLPAVLAESAYMLLPDQEARLLDPDYRGRLARTLLEGLRSYFRAYQELQAASPYERRAARRPPLKE